MKECQLKDWKEGNHRKACRPPKDFKAQDLVRVMGVTSRQGLNGMLLEVIGPDPSDEDRWEVNVLGADTNVNKSISLHRDKLHLAVPVEERSMVELL